MLEVISKYPEESTQPLPLLFIHGIFSSAKIWEPFFLPYFAQHGYASHAVSLRGHGQSDGGDSPARLKDYVDDLEQVVAEFETPPVLVGTSMGGVIVQHYLRDHSAPAVVLLASGPPQGMMVSSFLMMATNPLLAQGLGLMSMFGPKMASISTLRSALFRSNTPDEYVAQFLPYAEPESPLAMLDLLGFDLAQSQQSQTPPTLVLGAEKDAFISEAALKDTARAFGVDYEVFPGMAHGMMLDPDWQQVADRMLSWLSEMPSRERSV
jgi:pimeloyl-ACP methyl ester carboxylesterase